jgi:hypothetical protein
VRFPLVFHLALTHLGWDAQRQIYSSVQGPSRVEMPTNKYHHALLSAFRDRGVPGPTSEMSPRAPAQMGRRETEHEAGKRQPEREREVEIPRPSCLSRAQVGCACSRGLQASTRERERAASRERLSRPLPRAANPLSFYRRKERIQVYNGGCSRVLTCLEEES